MLIIKVDLNHTTTRGKEPLQPSRFIPFSRARSLSLSTFFFLSKFSESWTPPPDENPGSTPDTITFKMM